MKDTANDQRGMVCWRIPQILKTLPVMGLRLYVSGDNELVVIGFKNTWHNNCIVNQFAVLNDSIIGLLNL